MKKLLFVFPMVVLLAAACSQQAPNQTPVVQNTNPAPAATPTPSPAPTPTKTGSNYLIIKEWGVELQEPAGMEDLKYIVQYNTATDGAVYFSTQQLVNLDRQFNTGKTYCDVEQAPIGSLGRANHLPGPNDKAFPTNLKIGNYYYWFEGPQATCSANAQVNGLETQQIAPLKNAISNLIAISAGISSQNLSWKDIVLGEFSSVTDWQQSNPSDWQFADYTNEAQHRSQLKIYGMGKILLLSKTFNGNGCQSDCSAEGVAQNNLIASVKTSLSQNGWSPVSWPTEPSFYTDYLYIKNGHPLILQVGTRDAVTGGMYVDIEFQY